MAGNITVLTPSNVVDLTLLTTVKTELGLTETTDDAFFTTKIRQASKAIYRYLGRSALARRQLYEGLVAYDRSLLIVDQTPLLVVSSIILTDTPAVDQTPQTIDSNSYAISDQGLGFIFCEDGWFSTEIVGFSDTWNMVLERLPVPPNNGMYYATYIAGWLMPGDDVVSATGSGTPFSFLSSDGSLNTTGTFPVLVPGDLFTTSGATNSQNNGTFTVKTATANKIVTVEDAFVSESPPTSGFAIAFRAPTPSATQGLPEDIENACIQTVKAWYFQRDRDPFVKTERIGGTRSGAYMAEYVTEQSLPTQATDLLDSYRRIGD